jgi:hypothetical protein
LQGVLSYLAKVPAGSIIAATPAVADPIPTFSKRKVLFSNRMSLTLQSLYYDEIKKRIYDFYEAYYSDSFNEIRNFCVKYSVDYIVLDKNDFLFDPEHVNNRLWCPEPFESHIWDIIRKRSSLFFSKIDKNQLVFEDNGFMILNTSSYHPKITYGGRPN